MLILAQMFRPKMSIQRTKNPISSPETQFSSATPCFPFKSKLAPSSPFSFSREVFSYSAIYLFLLPTKPHILSPLFPTARPPSPFPPRPSPNAHPLPRPPIPLPLPIQLLPSPSKTYSIPYLASKGRYHRAITWWDSIRLPRIEESAYDYEEELLYHHSLGNLTLAEDEQ